MAQQPQVPTYYDTEKDVVDRLSKFKGDFNYHAQASLPVLSQAIEEVKAAANDVDVAAAALKAAKAIHNKKVAVHKATKKKLRDFVAADKGKECDEFVILGGTRQSEVIAAQQQAREENKKAAEVKKKAEETKSATA